MLSLLRRKAQSPIIQGTVVIIALVFIFWGVGTSQKGGGVNAVITVNDEPVGFQEYQQTYDRNVSRIRDQLGGNIPKGLLDSLNIKAQVLDQLIQKKLLKQGAEEMGILVSAEEIKTAIEEMEAFRTNGVFDLQQYETLLSASRMTPTIFEDSMRSDLVTSKVMESLGRFTKIGDNELKEHFLYENETIKLEYVSLVADDFIEKVEVDDEDLKVFFEENKQNYTSDPQVQLNYLSFSKAVESEQVEISYEISDEELEEYYQRNINRYTAQEQRSARHILFKTSEEDSQETREEKFIQAEKVLEQARAGENFNDLAMQFSEGPSASKGGDLGLFGRGKMVKPFEDEAFRLEEGEISEIVETTFGYHIIKVEKIVPAGTKPLDEVKESIKTALEIEKVKNQSFAKANKAYEDIIFAGSLAKYAENNDVEILETDFFERKAPPAGEEGSGSSILSNPVFLNAAFALKKGELSSLVDLGQAYAVIYVKDIKDPEVKPLEEVKEQVVNDYKEEQGLVLAREAAENLLSTLREGSADQENWQKEVQKLGLESSETDFVTRSGITGGSGQQLPFSAIEKGFRLSTVQQYPEEIETSGNIFFVYRFKEKKESETEIFEEKQGEYKDQLFELRKQELLTAWLEHRKSKAEIVTNEQLL